MHRALERLRGRPDGRRVRRSQLRTRRRPAGRSARHRATLADREPTAHRRPNAYAALIHEALGQTADRIVAIADLHLART
jgi:hypothetical protein